MRMIDLFSGIGGFSIAASLVWGDDLEIVCFCELDKFCQQVLRKHWPDIPIVEDVNDLESIVAYAKGEKVQTKPTLLKDYQEAVKMYEDGLSIGEIAGKYEITRQAMWKILKRRGVKFRPNLRFGKENHFYRGTKKQFAIRKRAQHLVEMAIERGEIEQSPCEVCGDPSAIGHHDDYAKPLEVRWLCKPHHFEWHSKNEAVYPEEPYPTLSKQEISSIGGKASWEKLTEEQRIKKLERMREKRWLKENNNDSFTESESISNDIGESRQVQEAKS